MHYPSVRQRHRGFPSAAQDVFCLCDAAAHSDVVLCASQIFLLTYLLLLTICVNVIDCAVGAVVEQVYSGVVTCIRDNYTRHQYLTRFTSMPTSKCTKMRLVTGLLSDSLGELTALPSSLV